VIQRGKGKSNNPSAAKHGRNEETSYSNRCTEAKDEAGKNNYLLVRGLVVALLRRNLEYTASAAGVTFPGDISKSGIHLDLCFLEERGEMSLEGLNSSCKGKKDLSGRGKKER